VGYFEQALGVLPHIPKTRSTREQAVDLQLALRTALQPSGDSGRMLAALREAEALAEALDDPRRLAQVSGYLSFDFCRRGLYDQATAAAQRALVLTTASGEVILQRQAQQWLGRAYFHQGDYRRAIACFGQTAATFVGALRYERFGAVALPAVHSRAFLACCHAELGTFTEGRVLGEEGLRIAEEVQHPASLMVASWGIGLLALRQGDLPRALPPLERAMGICQDAPLPVYLPLTAAALGQAYTLGERITDAVPLLTEAMAQAMAMARVDFQTLSSLPLGEAQLLASRLEEAYTLAEHTLALANERQERGDQAYALRLLGDIAVRRDPPERELAEGYYQQALALANELGMRPLQAHCHRSLGTLYGQVGRGQQARAALSTAIELYRAMEMTFWLPQAEAVLAQVEVASAPQRG
jgi:tetratricopeptide (TPR) repeat protein